jgi:hypothetical protein
VTSSVTTVQLWVEVNRLLDPNLDVLHIVHVEILFISKGVCPKFFNSDGAISSRAVGVKQKSSKRFTQQLCICKSNSPSCEGVGNLY